MKQEKKQGAFAYVSRIQNHRVLKVPKTEDPETRYGRALANEAYILDLLTRKKVACIPEYFGPRKTGLQMQYLPIQQADLKSYLQHLDLSQFREFLMQCFACLDALHRHVLHMDLHSGNLMFRPPTPSQPYPRLVFIDFGYSITPQDAIRNFPRRLLQGGPSLPEMIELYKRYERYELYGILLELYEEQQQQQPPQDTQRIRVLQQVAKRATFARQERATKQERATRQERATFARQERAWIDEFHDTANVMINEGRWPRGGGAS